MIIDRIENYRRYTAVDRSIATALKFLADNDMTMAETGRTDIEGENIFAVVDDYTTKNPAEAFPEAHHVYADVQFVASGSELLGYAPYEGQNLHKEYDREKDIEFYDCSVSFNRLETGMFAVLYPGEIHLPGIAATEQIPVRKVVVKVKM